MGNVTSQSDSDETTGIPTEESDTQEPDEKKQDRKKKSFKRGNSKNDITTEAPLIGENVDETTVRHDRVHAWEIDLTEWAGENKQRKYRSVRQSLRKLHKSQSDTLTQEQYDPPAVNSTQKAISERKVLDVRRWFCVSRPQYNKSCGISSLVSCWNYLHSSMGVGSMDPITQEEALTVLGFKPPFGDISFGPFTGNATLMRWFKQLNDFYGVRGRSYYLYKPHGKGRTMGRTSDEALRLLRAGLKDPSITFIYHCQNHYFCPIGYEDVPCKAVHAYRGELADDEKDTWVLIGDTSRRHPGIQCVKWQDIVKDLNLQNPEYLNIRKVHLGVQKRKTKKTGGNLHCIIAFQRSSWQGIRSIKPMKFETKSSAELMTSTSQEEVKADVDRHEGWTGDAFPSVVDSESGSDESLCSDD